MAKPEVIMHNSVSLDGRVTGFGVDMGLHYGIVGSYGADAYCAGSNSPSRPRPCPAAVCGSSGAPAKAGGTR